MSAFGGVASFGQHPSPIVQALFVLVGLTIAAGARRIPSSGALVSAARRSLVVLRRCGARARA